MSTVQEQQYQQSQLQQPEQLSQHGSTMETFSTSSIGAAVHSGASAQPAPETSSDHRAALDRVIRQQMRTLEGRNSNVQRTSKRLHPLVAAIDMETMVKEDLLESDPRNAGPFVLIRQSPDGTSAFSELHPLSDLESRVVNPFPVAPAESTPDVFAQATRAVNAFLRTPAGFSLLRDWMKVMREDANRQYLAQGGLDNSLPSPKLDIDDHTLLCLLLNQQILTVNKLTPETEWLAHNIRQFRVLVTRTPSAEPAAATDETAGDTVIRTASANSSSSVVLNVDPREARLLDRSCRALLVRDAPGEQRHALVVLRPLLVLNDWTEKLDLQKQDSRMAMRAAMFIVLLHEFAHAIMPFVTAAYAHAHQPYACEIPGSDSGILGLLVHGARGMRLRGLETKEGIRPELALDEHTILQTVRIQIPRKILPASLEAASASVVHDDAEKSPEVIELFDMLTWECGHALVGRLFHDVPLTVAPEPTKKVRVIVFTPALQELSDTAVIDVGIEWWAISQHV